MRGRRGGEGDRTRAGEEDLGDSGWCGAPPACAWLACEDYGRSVVEEVRGVTEGERIVSLIAEQRCWSASEATDGIHTLFPLLETRI